MALIMAILTNDSGKGDHPFVLLLRQGRVEQHTELESVSSARRAEALAITPVLHIAL